VGTLTAYIRQSGKAEIKVVENMEYSFPLSTVEDLQGMDIKIVNGNSELYSCFLIIFISKSGLSTLALLLLFFF